MDAKFSLHNLFIICRDFFRVFELFNKKFKKLL